MQVAPIVDHCHTAADVMAAGYRSLAFRRGIEEQAKRRAAAQRRLHPSAVMADIPVAPVADVQPAEPILPPIGPKITAHAIIRFTCAYFGIPRTAIFSTRRARHLVDKKFCLYWCMRELTKLSLPEIGRIAGGKDHSSILHGIRRVEASIAAGDELGKMATALRDAITGRPTKASNVTVTAAMGDLFPIPGGDGA